MPQRGVRQRYSPKPEPPPCPPCPPCPPSRLLPFNTKRCARTTTAHSSCPTSPTRPITPPATAHPALCARLPSRPLRTAASRRGPQFGNGIVAIVAGVAAEAAADAKALTAVGGAGGAPFGFHVGGYCTPFDLSALMLLLCGLAISCTWGENYGEKKHAGSGGGGGGGGGGSGTGRSSLMSGLRAILVDQRLLLCGCNQALFEGPM